MTENNILSLIGSFCSTCFCMYENECEEMLCNFRDLSRVPSKETQILQPWASVTSWDRSRRLALRLLTMVRLKGPLIFMIQFWIVYDIRGTLWQTNVSRGSGIPYTSYIKRWKSPNAHVASAHTNAYVRDTRQLATWRSPSNATWCYGIPTNHLTLSIALSTPFPLGQR